MSDERTSDEIPRVPETPEAVPDADALEQAQEVRPALQDDRPAEDPEVPEADALEQSRVVPLEDDEQA